MAMTTRISDVVYSRINHTILSVMNLRQSATVSIAPAGLYNVLAAVFEHDSALIEDINSWLINDALIPNGDKAQPWLRTFLTLPLILFQPAAMNPHVSPSPYHPSSGLPENLYATAQLAKMNVRGWIPPFTLVIYVIMSLSLYGWCVACLIYTTRIQTPRSTPFVLVDFASRVIANGYGDGCLIKELTEVTVGDSEAVRERLQNKRIFLGEIAVTAEHLIDAHVGESRRRIGLGLHPGDVKELKRGTDY